MASTKSNFGKILQLHNIRRNYIAWLCNLAQLHSGYCTSLNSYLFRIDKDVPIYVLYATSLHLTITSLHAL